jgi:tetratricopeptide (TPR) repeat protein
MTGKEQSFVPALLISMVLLAGCGSFDKGEKARSPRFGEVRQPLAEQKKVRLLKQLDRKFEDPEAHCQLGQLYQADGLWSEAEYHYTTALTFDPVHWPAQAAMVKVLQESGDTAKSKLSAEIYMSQVSASAERSLQLGLAFQEQGLDDYALACYQQALDLAPNSARIHKRVGYYYLSKNDKVRAKEYLVRSFRLDPLQAEVAGELGRMGVAIKVPRKTQKSTKKLE